MEVQTYSAFTMGALAVVVLAALTLPFLIHKIEEELEIFLLVCGVAAVSISGLWSGHLVAEGLKEPLTITAAVLVLGVLFKKFGAYLAHGIHWLEKKTGPRILLFCTVLVLGLTSSVVERELATAYRAGSPSNIQYCPVMPEVALPMYMVYTLPP